MREVIGLVLAVVCKGCVVVVVLGVVWGLVL